MRYSVRQMGYSVRQMDYSVRQTGLMVLPKPDICGYNAAFAGLALRQPLAEALTQR